MSSTIKVEVAYALPEKQLIRALEVPTGTTALEAVTLSGIEEAFDELTINDSSRLGIFGKAVKSDHVLTAGERVEIYRPLLIDPKEVRKKRAAEAKERRSAE
ncbi:MAG: RnfH family protein [Cellvibrionales bacterium]|jgi:putative ubiquitin-RnfH superfamily antitoxin RatB of RatAB toxin-antitoxin module